jgi:hypothetical protein
LAHEATEGSNPRTSPPYLKKKKAARGIKRAKKI